MSRITEQATPAEQITSHPPLQERLQAEKQRLDELYAEFYNFISESKKEVQDDRYAVLNSMSAEIAKQHAVCSQLRLQQLGQSALKLQ